MKFQEKKFMVSVIEIQGSYSNEKAKLFFGYQNVSVIEIHGSYSNHILIKILLWKKFQ